MDVLALQVFDYLGLDGLGIGELFDHADGNAFEFRQPCGFQPACADDDFVLAFVQRTHQQRFQDSPASWQLATKFFEVLFIEALARVGR